MQCIFCALKYLTFASSILLVASETPNFQQVTEFKYDLAVPLPFEIESWKRQIIPLVDILRTVVDGDRLLRDKYSERREEIKLGLETFIAGESVWYCPDEAARRKTENLIRICSELLARMEKVFTSEPLKSMGSVTFESTFDGHDELLSCQEILVKCTRLSILRHLYDPYWRVECLPVIEDYAERLIRVGNLLKAYEFQQSPRVIRLQAAMNITSGLIDWLRPEASKLGNEMFVQEIVLNNMLTTLRELHLSMDSVESIGGLPERSNLKGFAEKTEHLATKFLYLEFRPSPLQKHVALGIFYIFTRLRNFQFYNSGYSEISLEEWISARGVTLETYSTAQLSFAKEVIGKLTLALFKHIFKSISGYDYEALPTQNRQDLLGSWRETIHSVMGEYEQWGLQNSVFSGEVYELYERIAYRIEIDLKFMTCSNVSIPTASDL